MQGRIGMRQRKRVPKLFNVIRQPGEVGVYSRHDLREKRISHGRLPGFRIVQHLP